MVKPDDGLVVGLNAGKVNAFDKLYRKYNEAVYRSINRIVKDPIIANDILQDVFVKLWEYRTTIKSDQSVAGWLFVVSFNLSISHSHKKIREQNLHKELFYGTQQAIEKDFLLYEEQHQLLERAIDQLSPQRKKVITLCKLEGKTYEEAARELNISHHTVKEYLSAAMANVNDYMRKYASKQNYVVIMFALLTLK